MEEILSREEVSKIFNSNIKIEIDNKCRELIIDYLYYLIKLNLLSEEVTIIDLINRMNEHIEKIVFFDENHEVNEKNGKDFKGWTNNINGKATLYIRDKLEDKELYFYHELTHLLNTNFNPDGSKKAEGIVDEERSGNIINEVIVQYTAERIYNEKYHITPSVRVYQGEEIRMSPNVKGASDMRNYQMYDTIISYFLMMIGVSKDELVRKQFVFGNHLLDYLGEKYDKAMDEIGQIDSKARIPYNFREIFMGEKENGIELHFFNGNREGLIDMLDYLYIADVMLYTQPDSKRKLQAGETLWCMNASGKKAYPISISYENQIYQFLLSRFISCKKYLENQRNVKPHENT